MIGQKIFVGPIGDLFSQLRKIKQSFILHNLKFRQISKSPEEISRTLIQKIYFQWKYLEIFCEIPCDYLAQWIQQPIQNHVVEKQ